MPALHEHDFEEEPEGGAVGGVKEGGVKEEEEGLEEEGGVKTEEEGLEKGSEGGPNEGEEGWKGLSMMSWREAGTMWSWAGGALVVVSELVSPLLVAAIAEFGAPLVSTAVNVRPSSKWNEMTRTKT